MIGVIPTARERHLTGYSCQVLVIMFLLCTTAGCAKKTPRPSLSDGLSTEMRIPDGVTWASLLRDAADLSTLTVAPAPGARSLLFSSSAATNKVMLAHLAPEVLGDMDHGFFLRVEDTESYVEATLIEASGPGVITWVWSANPVGEAVLYVDDERVPVLQMPFSSFLAGSFLPVQYPYAALTAHGYNLHFPIVHTNGIRLAVRAQDRKALSSLFYHVAWNSLPRAEIVHPFDLKDLQSSAGLLRSLAMGFFGPATSTEESVVRESEFVINPADSNVFFQSETAGTICSLDVTAESKAALTDLWIEAHWDGHSQPAMSVPISMLAGTSLLCEDTASLPCTLSGSRVTFRWQMPFGPSSKLTVLNKGRGPHRVRTICRVASREKGPLRFHAGYARNEGLQLTLRNVVTLGQMSGPGYIVGCSLRVDSRSAKWWGEGDEMIWLDQLEEPAWRGTGTEDYFGFAWCSDMTFDHPLRGQTRADGSRTNRRIAAMHRYHLLDRLPFQRFAKFDMEAWGLADGFMDLETALMWYGPPEQSGTEWLQRWLDQTVPIGDQSTRAK